MLVKRTFPKVLLGVFAVISCLCIFELLVTFRKIDNIGSIVQSLHNYHKNIRFIFPAYYKDSQVNSYLSEVAGSTYYKYGGSKFPSGALDTMHNDKNFHKHKITMFHSSKNIEKDLDRCYEDLRKTSEVFVNKAENIDVDLTAVLKQLIRDLPNNRYYREIAPFFLDQLKEQLRDGEPVTNNWFQLAGSSVWLEDFGVHFMIRRIIYSPSGARNAPIISLAYAQVFDDNWNELKDTNLVLPGNKGKRSSKLSAIKFPTFLKVPFFHEYDVTDNRYYGPEDPRITKYKTKYGHYEPIIVFNSMHRKFEKYDDDEDHTENLQANYYRSMWLCFPFEFQSGKFNMDDFHDDFFDLTDDYTRVEELRIKNKRRQEKQKNWTPFFGFNEKSVNPEDNYDNFVNFVYRWSSLEILKCDIKSAICDFDYKLNPNLLPHEGVGELRGGTELLSVNELLVQSGIDWKKFLPDKREVWLGFARAHIDNCGCGPVMYRPNMVLLVKDIIEEDGKERDVYKISHVSSSISFDMDITGWFLEEPGNLCAGSNILIPNGISSWIIDKHGDNKDKVVDYLTLTLSVGDLTVEKIDVRNLLREIYKQTDVFKTGENPPYMPGPKDLIGYNDDNVECAMYNSKAFCKMYGQLHGAK